MEGINWIELLPVIIPILTTLIFAVLSFVLKMRKDEMEGLGKEVSELVLKLVDAAKDRHFTQQEIKDIITEAQDVIEEAKKLLKTD
jgi:methionine synthase II (cobalamin-independent)